jgi:hypothetical protein
MVLWDTFRNVSVKSNRNMLRLVPDDFKSVRRIDQSGPDNAVYMLFVDIAVVSRTFLFNAIAGPLWIFSHIGTSPGGTALSLAIG